MKITRVKTINRKFYLCKNIFMRTRIRSFRKKLCWNCGKVKRITESLLLFSDRNSSYWNDTTKLWKINSNDYIWICRDCKNKEPNSTLHLSPQQWYDYTNFEYHYPEREVVNSVPV